MKTIIITLTFALLLNNCRSSNPFTSSALQSATMIPAGKTFELGGNGNGAFSAQVSNVGDVVVAVSQRQADGQVKSLSQLKPGDQQTLTFVAGATAVFANAFAQDANLGLRVVGDTNLKMWYAKENK